MITRKELGYIKEWPKNIPYPGEDYCLKTLLKLKECFYLYNDEYLNRRYTIQFSNNEEIDFEIESKNLAHILGIDYKNLMSDYFNVYREKTLDLDPNTSISSYSLLENIIYRINEILDFDERKQTCKALNYYKIAIRCDIFSKLANLSKFNYGCINFDKATYDRENPDIPLASQSTKFLYTPSDEVIAPYFMMGLKTDNYNLDGKYIVETLVAADNPRKFFVSQEVVIPTQILTDDCGTLDKNIAQSQEKIKLLKEYQNIVHEYNIPNMVNIYGDYYSILMSQRDNDQKLTLK